MSEYDVDGIPHFVFLDAAGRKQGQVIGRLPKEVLRSDAEALVAGAALPYAKAAGASCAHLYLPAGRVADPIPARRGDVGCVQPRRAHDGVGLRVERCL